MEDLIKEGQKIGLIDESGAIKIPDKHQFPCYDFLESDEWRSNKDLKIGVTWDAYCSKCGFEIKNQPFDQHEGLGISFGGRRLSQFYCRKIMNGEAYKSEKSQIICSECIKIINQSNDEVAERAAKSFSSLFADKEFQDHFVEFMAKKQ